MNELGTITTESWDFWSSWIPMVLTVSLVVIIVMGAVAFLSDQLDWSEWTFIVPVILVFVAMVVFFMTIATAPSDASRAWERGQQVQGLERLGVEHIDMNPEIGDFSGSLDGKFVLGTITKISDNTYIVSTGLESHTGK